MKEYEKPVLEMIELRLEERIARCSDEPSPGGGDNGGDTPGNQGNCPGDS